MTITTITLRDFVRLFDLCSYSREAQEAMAREAGWTVSGDTLTRSTPVPFIYRLLGKG